jgi:hypothetical protein
MGKVRDFRGHKIGRLLVLEDTNKRTNKGQIIWKCQCECGNYKEVSTKDFSNNKYGNPRIQSCGCLGIESRYRRGRWFRNPEETSFIKPIHRITSIDELSQDSIWLCQCKLCNKKFEAKRKHLSSKHGCPECMKQKMIQLSKSMKGKRSCHWKGTENISHSYFTSVKSGAKAREIEFKLRINDLEYLWRKQKGICAISKLPIMFSEKITAYGESTASLDRIDSSKGYTKDNIQWVHKNVNRMKWDLSQEQLITLCKAIANANP